MGHTLSSLFINTCMVIALAYLLSLTYQSWRPPGLGMVWFRTLFAAITAILLMFHGITLPGDLQVDVRMVPIVLLALRYGVGFAVAAVVPVVLVRMYFFSTEFLPIYLMSLAITFALVLLVRWRFATRLVTWPVYFWTPLVVFSLHTLPILTSPAAPEYFSRVFVWYVLFNVVGFWLSARILLGRVEYLRATEHLQQESLTDPLTGVLNRRQFQRDASGFGPGDTLLVLDLDHFKRVNDQHGHAIGDEVLRQFAALLKSSTRDTDRIYRMGGEEFLVVLRKLQAKLPGAVAERIREMVASHSFPVPYPVTVSGGLVVLQPEIPLNEALERADALLYQAKAAGRNRILAAEA